MKVTTCRVAVLVACAVSMAGAEVSPRFNPRFESAGAKNLLQNASFECGDYMWSTLGRQTGWGGELSGLHGTVVSDEAWDGRHSLRIDLGPGKTPQSYFDVWPPAHVVQHAPLAGNIGWTEVQQGQELTLSAYLRASVPGTKVHFLFRFADNALEGLQQAVHEVTVSQQWARYSVTQAALKRDVCVALGPDLSETPDVAVSLWMDAVQLEAAPSATRFDLREPIEVGFSTMRYGNVYDSGDVVTLMVFGTNRGAEQASIEMKLEGEDYFETQFSPVTLELRIPAGESVSVPWTLPALGKGHFRGCVTWSVNGRERVRPLEWAVIQPYGHDESPFGLNHPATTARQLKLLSQAGLRWARCWAVNWEWVEPVQGEVSWKVSDALMGYLADAGMKTLCVFPNPSTSWATTAPDTVKDGMWYRLAYAPSDPELLFAFIGASVERYRDRCRVWEFLNEPLWVPDFCLPKTAGYTVADYIALLEGASRAIKAADPGANVVGGLAIQPEMPFGDEFIAAGGLDHTDNLNLHPYGRLTPPEDFIVEMERVLEAMDARDQRKPIWGTETGYYAVDDKPWEPWVAPKGHFAAELLLPSERVCADYIVRHAVIMMSHGVEKLFYHEPIEGTLNDGTRDVANPFQGQEGVAQKPLVALSALANLLGPAPRYVCPAEFPAEVTETGAPLFGYVFECDGRSVAVVWAPGHGIVVDNAILAPGVTAYDVVGNAANKVVVGDSPVYLVGTSQAAAELAHGWFLRPADESR